MIHWCVVFCVCIQQRRDTGGTTRSHCMKQCICGVAPWLRMTGVDDVVIVLC